MKDADDWARAVGVLDVIADVQADPTYLAPGQHSPISEGARGEALAHLGMARQILVELDRSLRVLPDDDQTFERLAEALFTTLGDAGTALQRFRDIRECEGAA